MKVSIGEHKMRDNVSNGLDSNKANVGCDAHHEISAVECNETEFADDGRKIMFLEKAKLCLENKE